MTPSHLTLDPESARRWARDLAHCARTTREQASRVGLPPQPEETGGSAAFLESLHAATYRARQRTAELAHQAARLASESHRHITALETTDAHLADALRRPH